MTSTTVTQPATAETLVDTRPTATGHPGAVTAGDLDAGAPWAALARVAALVVTIGVSCALLVAMIAGVAAFAVSRDALNPPP